MRDALDGRREETGCTVHLATLEMDAGPILAQEVVPVLPGDTEESLHERIKVAERALYPATIGLGARGARGRTSIEPPAPPAAHRHASSNEEMTT